MNPFEGFRISSPFGYRMHPVDHVKRFHRGVDLVTTPSNGELHAFVAGKVLHAKMGAIGSGFGNMGNVVAIKDDRGYLHVYAHLSSVAVAVGQYVNRGQVIGRQGSTGKSTGPHLHYEIRKASSPSFGYTPTEAGVVEPTKYLQDYYAADQPIQEVIKEEDQPMTKEEKAVFEQLQKTVSEQGKLLADLKHSKDVLKKSVEEVGSLAKKLQNSAELPLEEVPEWAKEAVSAAYSAGVINQQDKGTLTFYRLITVLYRAGMIIVKAGEK